MSNVGYRVIHNWNGTDSRIEIYRKDTGDLLDSAIYSGLFGVESVSLEQQVLGMQRYWEMHLDTHVLLVRIAELERALREEKLGECWCQVGIGNPMYRDHTEHCTRVRTLLGEL